jgi:GR25 family glycosyltransferase involved in LPS biosynthesis
MNAAALGGAVQLPKLGSSVRDTLAAELKQHWAAVLQQDDDSNTSRNDTASAFEHVLQCLLPALAAYDSVAQGWRMSVVGTSRQLSVRLVDRMRIVRRVLQEIAGLDGLPPGPLPAFRSDVDVWALSHVLRTTSLPPAALAEVCLALNACCASAVPLQAAISSGGEQAQEATLLLQDLRVVCTDLTDIISNAWLECLCYFLSASAKACLVTCEAMPSSSHGGVSFMKGALAMLRALPAPWGTCSDNQAALQALHAEMALVHKRPGEYSCASIDMHNTLQLSQKVPAFVISLERRPDRMRQVMQLSSSAGILSLPLRAVDGLLLCVAADAAAAGTEVPEVAAALTQVVEAAVRPTWDSSLNRQYDPQCFASTEVPMTYSERACAASHVAAWQQIEQLRRQIFGTCPSEACDSSDGGGGSQTLQTSTQSAFRLTLAGGGWEPYVGVGPDSKARFLGMWPKAAAASASTQNGQQQQHHGDSPDSDSDWYLILEDDAALNPKECPNPAHFQRLMYDTLHALPDDWDLLYLGYAAHPRGRGAKVKGSVVPLFRAVYLWQLHGYVIRGRSVHKLLRLLPVKGPVDNFLAALTYDETLVAYARQASLLIQPGSVTERQASSDVRHSARDVVTGNRVASRSSKTKMTHDRK